MSWQRNQQRGFTLLELLLAIGIFGVIAGLAYAGLRSAVLGDQAMAEQSAALAELKFAIGLIERDLRAALPRPSRDLDGNTLPPMAGDQRGWRMTRAGWDNPLELNRSELERVRYQLENGALQRLAWPVLDLTRGSLPQVETLLENVESWRLSFLDTRGVWQTRWPLPTSTDRQRAWPKAVRVELNSGRFGSVYRVVMLVESPVGPPSAPDLEGQSR